MSGQSGLFAIIGKEFRRFFTDRRIVMTTILLPGLMIYVMYSFMGGAMEDMLTVDDDYQPVIYSVNMPDSLELVCESTGLDFIPISFTDVEKIQASIANKEVDLLAIFPEDFDIRLTGQLAGEDGIETPRIEIFYNSTKTESSYQYQVMMVTLDQYKTTIAPLFAVNAGVDTSFSGGNNTGVDGNNSSDGSNDNSSSYNDLLTGNQQLPNYDLATDEDTAGFMFASMLPMLIMIFLFTGSMAVATESIAGEKERGTIATMLVTPLSRWELAFGKIISLACIALLSGLSSFLGVMLSLPKLLGAAISGEATSRLYGVSDYLLILAVILSTVLLFIGALSVFSALARTIKEAGTYITPLMLVVVMISVTGLFSQGANSNVMLYLVPVFNSVQCLIGIFSFAANPLSIALAVTSNVVYTGIAVVVLSWMFGNEKVVFSR